MGLKGILLAGGSGTRLYPMTLGASKQLMGLYDKPMVYYPLSVLMLAGIREILVVTTAEDRPSFVRLLGDGSRIGLSLAYAAQPRPEGIAQALVIARAHVGYDRMALVLGDNVFFGHGLEEELALAAGRERGATVFGYRVRDPQRYGVVDFDEGGAVRGIEEKPEQPRSSYAITGLYFYDNRALDIAAGLRPSARGELEITDVNAAYLAWGELGVRRLGRGMAWLDTGTHESLLQAANFIHAVQERQGQMIACIEEIAFNLGYIGAEQLLALARPMQKNRYGQYLARLAEERG